VTSTEIVPKKERAALRSAVRTKMRGMRAALAEREEELLAQVETRLAFQRTEGRARREEFNRRARELTDTANREYRALKTEFADLRDNGNHWFSSDFHAPSVTFRSDNGDREQIRKALIARAKADARRAGHQLDQLEAQLLTDLALEEITSDEAKTYMAKIPSLDELMPPTLAKLEIEER